MFTVYIIYSSAIDAYYVGQTEDFERRFQWHDDKIFFRAFTKRATDWVLFFSIECVTRKQAVAIESHIKRMKSRRYIENVRIYPDIVLRLKLKYNNA